MLQFQLCSVFLDGYKRLKCVYAVRTNAGAWPHTPPSANNNPGGGQANGHGEVRCDHFDVNYSIPVSPQPSVKRKKKEEKKTHEALIGAIFPLGL